MALNDFTGQNIKDTFQRVIQTDGTNFADGTGSIIPIALSTEVSGAFAEASTSFDVRINNLKTDSGSFSTRLTALKSDSGSFEDRVTDLKTDSGSFSTRVTDLKTDSGSFSTHVTGLKTDSGSFSTRVTDLKTDSGSFSTRVTDLKSDSGSFSTRVTDLKSDSGSFSTRVTGLKTDSGSFSTRVTDLKSDSGSFSTRVTDLKSDSGSFSDRITVTEASASRTNVEFLNVSSSRVTASELLVTDATSVNGSFAYNGLALFEDNIIVRSGSTIFGSGSMPSDVTHQFTGSIFNTGSIDVVGQVTATSFNGIFEGVISSSAQLSTNFLSSNAFTPAGISGSWQGQSFISSSQVTENLPSGIISSSNQLPAGIISSSNQLPSGIISSSNQLPAGIVSSSAQVKLSLPADTISSSNQLPSGIISSSNQLPSGIISSSQHIFTAITSSGDISASGNAFLNLTENATTTFKTVVVDPDTGRLYRTGSYGGSGGSDANFSAVGEDILPAGTHNLGAFDKKWQAIFAEDTFFGGIHEINLETKGLDQLQPGTVLVSKAGKMVPCTTEADSLIMGIVSSGHNFPIILGAEPVLVNGPVYEGDYIITSNIIGHGKAVNPSKIFELQLFGKIIAQSLETKTEGGLIRAMIRKM